MVDYHLIADCSGYDLHYSEATITIDLARIYKSDIPPGSDCPYPIWILAFFEMMTVSHCDTDFR